MLSLGVCIGAIALTAAMMAHGRSHPELSDFAGAFWVVTAISFGALFWNLRSARDAGGEISGHVEARGVRRVDP